ncbi:septum formation inhibitor Maf [Candidatus Thioglobus autotrophicus]|uniref:7-methyl-GTP pyrophosphatase n=1 Tax=Candidatus Thioglobus autotrophicus TaxID=1705394 RepID=A0A0M4NWA4_9GAMM|nr:nucleoside triphosphate pyrophosphatase [Candidatus Thioglobus autotrophicus]ALE52380.1 septum formation inhibitor Maf [Candidatus Thioglobus autotrophicus]WPE16391.1 nucleoside triphosphate pyrophosphatase [Candidatus Thioglobus autotrophicus]WPE17939.1 nucleoside triphosphate pyrophosphatase [Candidatus Thioglobus autotrophicus]
MALILASSSPFRQTLLNKLGLEFSVVSPNVDESRKPEETPEQLVYRLAQDKAREVAKSHDGLIIASDQVATLPGALATDEKILGKPHTHENAIKQLSSCSGNIVTFRTSLCLLNTNSGNIQTLVENFKVVFKDLSSAQIDNYLKKEQPYNCAGSFKSEGLGIGLFSRLEGNDPNTLIGLPLIQLIKFLENEGIDILSSKA